MINPSRFRLIAIGKVRKRWINEGIANYLKRLPGITIKEIKESSPEKEAATIKTEINSHDLIITLCEEGEQLTSIDFSRRLQSLSSHRLVFIIGGPDGISKSLKNQSNLRLSLSSLTLPHDIARLILLEQLYRATTICQGGPYHRA